MSNFKFEAFIFCEEKDLLFYEQRFINVYWDNSNICYNIAKNVTAPMKGLKLSEEAKQKLSASLTGKKRAPFTAEAKANMSAGMKGKLKSEATKENMRIARQRIRDEIAAGTRQPQKHSEEAKEKLRQRMMSRKRDTKGRLV
jgi:hypothetical protein